MAKTVTLEQFLGRLRKTPRKWRVDQRGMRRRQLRYDDCRCPVERVFNLPEGAWHHAPMHVGTLGRIVEAADWTDREPALRARLLAACGVA